MTEPAGGDTHAESATVRVFIALAPPDEAKDELAHALGRAYDTYPRMRWNRIEDWHITLAFLGELPVEAVPLLRPPLATSSPGRSTDRETGTGRFAA